MIWVSWRQHRGQATASLGLLTALSVFAILVSTSMRTAFSHDGLAACLAHSAGTSCPAAISAFMNSFDSMVNISSWAVLFVVPGLIGVIAGAPLLGRELELGTWRLAWSQTVPRTRWLAAQLTLVTSGLVLLGAVITAVIAWYREPMDRLTGHFINRAYDFEGLVLTAYILAAFGFAVLAGLLLRRTVAAMVAAFGPWLVIRLVVEFWLRPRFQAPLTLRQSCAHGCHATMGLDTVPPQTGHIGDWVLSVSVNAGKQVVTTYQPGSRFWHFQLIEAGLFVALTAAALSATIWLLHQRAAWTALSPAQPPATDRQSRSRNKETRADLCDHRRVLAIPA